MARSRNEIGIRIALGADRASVLRLVMREAGLLLIVGLALGTALSIAAARAATSSLYGVRAGARGIVLAGVGNGNANRGAVAAAAAAARSGIALVRSSRTGGGVVERNVEMDDDRLGFIASDELNPQKARILLMLGLTVTADRERLQEMFYTY